MVNFAPMKRLAVISFLLICAWTAAQEPLVPSVVSDKAREGVLVASDTVSLQALRQSVSVADAVRHLAGVQVRDYGGLGGLKTLNVRSMGSEHTGVFLDGIQVDNTQNMQVDLGRFSTDNLSGAKLYNGQRSAILQTAKEYGTASALYLESASPVFGDKPYNIRGGLTAGPFLAISPYITLERKLGPMTGSVSGSASFSDGRYPFRIRDYRNMPDGTIAGYDTLMVRQNSDLRSGRFQARLSGAKGWDIMAYAYGSERGLPGAVFKRDGLWPQSSDRQADLNIFVQGTWTKSLGKGNTMRLRGKVHYDYLKFSDYSEFNPSVAPAVFLYKQDGAYVSFTDAQELGPRWRICAAADLQADRLDASLKDFCYPLRTTFYGALSSMYVGDRVKASASLLYTGALDTYGITSTKTWRDAFSPFASISISPLKDLLIGAFAKRTYRLPSFNDLYYTTVGNASLKAEDAWQFDLSASYGTQTWGISAEGYYNRVGNKIIAVPTASQFRWSMYNIAAVDILGAEAKAWIRFESFGGALRYTFQKASNHSDPSSPYYGHQVPYIPLHTADLYLWGSLWGFKADASLLFCSERFSSPANLPAYRLSPWATLDLSLSKEFALGGGKMTLSLIGRNILNHRYELVEGYPMPGANILLKADFRF